MSIYLIRHAQSAFNAVYGPNKPDPMIFDARITELGETQAKQARTEVEKLDIKNVIVSPFTRTLQTAQLIFENRLPFQINAAVREQLGLAFVLLDTAASSSRLYITFMNACCMVTDLEVVRFDNPPLVFWSPKN